MAKFTFLEVHLDGADVTANAPFSDADGRAEPASESEGESGAESEEGGGSLSSLVVALLALVALGLLARKLLGASADGPVDHDGED